MKEKKNILETIRAKELEQNKLLRYTMPPLLVPCEFLPNIRAILRSKKVVGKIYLPPPSGHFPDFWSTLDNDIAVQSWVRISSIFPENLHFLDPASSGVLKATMPQPEEIDFAKAFSDHNWHQINSAFWSIVSLVIGENEYHSIPISLVEVKPNAF